MPYSHIVNEKFKYFVTLLGENCIIDKCDAVDFLRKIYKKSNIECELIVYALDNIINSVKKMYILLLIGSRCLKFDLKLIKLN